MAFYLGMGFMDLFSRQALPPLAERLRPHSLDEVSGQQHLIGAGKPLRVAVDSGKPHSMLLWGPPGVGKTTLARILANSFNAQFIPLSAVLSGVKDIRTAVEQAQMALQRGQATILFVDGIDARPRDIDNEQYFECLVGLVNAVLEMNQSFLKEKQIKIMLLIRPDIMYKMPVHNMNQKLRNNSVLCKFLNFCL